MPTQPQAVINIDSRGRYVRANQAALALLGVTHAELRASALERFAIHPFNEAEQKALVAEWESHGAGPLVGTAGLKRADGSTVRVSYAVEADGGGFRARLWPVAGSPEAPATVFTVAGVLREWRAAERQLAALGPGSLEWEGKADELELLRSRYQEVFKAVNPQD